MRFFWIDSASCSEEKRCQQGLASSAQTMPRSRYGFVKYIIAAGVILRRRAVAAALKEVYKAADADAGAVALEAFAESDWGQKYPAIAMSWRRHWQAVIPFFAFPDDVRRLIYTTNAIEALNAKLRRAVRTRGHFPTDESVTKLLFLVLNLAEKEWKMPAREWAMAKAQFAILFEDRFRIAQ